MRYALLDTSIYIGHWENNLYRAFLEQMRGVFIIRHSSVVLSELYRGARTKRALQLVEGLYKLAPRWTPTDADWRRGGRILAQLALQRGWDARRIRDLQNDVLIALTARQYGAMLVTTNRKDFDELGKIIEFKCIYV